MKVIAGKYGGRRLIFPKTTQTRPLSDKVREALFNILGDVSGLSILDAYAGSGAVSFEALSRGAGKVVAVEWAKEPIKAMQTSKQQLGVGSELTIMESRVEKAIESLPPHSFDCIVADPPYVDITPDILNKLGMLLVPQGSLVVSHSSRIAAPELESMQRESTRKYGDSSLSFYKNRPVDASNGA